MLSPAVCNKSNFVSAFVKSNDEKLDSDEEVEEENEEEIELLNRGSIIEQQLLMQMKRKFLQG